MFVHGQIRYEQIVLGTETQRAPDGLHVGLDVVTLDKGRAWCGTYQTGQHRHGGGLSSTVVAQQDGYLVRMYVDGQFVDDVFTGRETFAQRLDLYTGFFGDIFGTDFFLEPVRRLKRTHTENERM